MRKTETADLEVSLGLGTTEVTSGCLRHVQYLHRYSFEMKIWVSSKIDSQEVSWGEFLVVDLGDFMLGKVVNIVSFVLDEENKMAVCCRIGKDVCKEACTSISIIGENIHRHVYGQRIRDGLWPHLLNYVPSPVHILKKSNLNPKGKRKRINYKEV